MLIVDNRHYIHTVLGLLNSEHPVGVQPVSDIHWFPSILIIECWMWDVSPSVRSMKLQLAYG